MTQFLACERIFNKVKNQLNTRQFGDKALKFCPKLKCLKYKCPKCLVFNVKPVIINLVKTTPATRFLKNNDTKNCKYIENEYVDYYDQTESNKGTCSGDPTHLQF